MMNNELLYRDFANKLKERWDNHSLGLSLKRTTQDFADKVLGLLFPHFCKEEFSTSKEVEIRLNTLDHDLKVLLRSLLKETSLNLEEISIRFMSTLPDVHEKLWLDAEAITNGDPAAESIDEVILAYPGFTAIAMYRLAHEFYTMHVPIFPRLLTEYAHQMTGIDIHPGAQIGTSFAIDHGTGIVIGESTVIGHHVKMYQGVTLGALSVDKKLARSKRHPTVENHTVLYAQAVILGGETVIGHHSVIGGNVWLTDSVPPYSVVVQENRVNIRPKEMTDTPINFSI
jgi:serine O-acetyltransferase